MDEEVIVEDTRRSGRQAGRISAKDQRKSAINKYKLGKEARDALLEQAEDDDLYDEVDEETYADMRKNRDAQDDFLVYDDGDDGGYRDDGQEIFDEEDYIDGGTSNANRRAKKAGATGPRVRKAKAVKKRVNSLFTGGGKASRLGAAVVKLDDEKTVGSEDSFLADILAEDDGTAPDNAETEAEAELKALRARKRKKKGGLAHLALFGSTAEAREAYLEGPTASPGTIGGSHTGSPHKKRYTTPAGLVQPAFVSPPSKDSMITHAQEDVMLADLPEQPELVPEKPAQPVKKTAKVVHMMTEEELEEIEATTDGSKDHLKVSKAVVDTEDWKSVRRETSEVREDVKVDSGTIPTHATLEDGSTIMRFFWLDAYEGEGHKSGTIYLFGKVWLDDAKTYVSCCVAVANNERNIFVLPRAYKLDSDGDVTDEKVTLTDVYQELEGLCTKGGIQRFECKPVERKYAFEQHDVPSEATWMKVKYNASFPKLQAKDRNGNQTEIKGKTFSHMFGNGIGPLERFLMKRDLMGPCWLDIKCATKGQSISWCKLEVEVNDPKFISRTKDSPQSPPLVTLSLNLQTILNRKSNSNEILVVSGLVHNAVECDGPTLNPDKGLAHFTAIRKLGDNPFPFDFRSRAFQTRKKTLEICQNERQLLAFIMAKIAKIDPDVIVGHDLLGFDLDVLLHRIKACNIPHWSRIGRLKRSVMPKLTFGAGGGRANFASKAVASGRMLVDVKISAREFVRQTTYEMNELVERQLDKKTKREDLDADMIPSMFNQSETLLGLCDFVERDAYLVLTLMFKLLILPLSKQISNITGGLFARVFAGGRSERNEYLLCHEFHRRKYIVPDKKQWEIKKPDAGDDDVDGIGQKKGPRRKKAQYAGGLVLEPKKGFYDKMILLLDFNSLYPSIIQEYNLCFTTVERKPGFGASKEGDEDAVPMAEVPESSAPPGILPKVIRGIIAKRKAVKDLIKNESNPQKLVDYNVRQLALKLTANSMYGCLGFTASRFHAQPIAALITSKGREILQKTVDLAQDTLNLDVIYGDTDSIMINTRCTDLTQVKKIGNKVKKEVNDLYKELEIEIDGVFKTMLLLKKKKYAAITISEKNGVVSTARETKGLDMVRRDWCGLSHDVGYHVLNQILTRESREDLVEACHDYLRVIASDIGRTNVIPVEKFIIHKGLTKDPKEYADAKTQPHVQVALRMNANGKKVGMHDTVPYLVCLDGENTDSSKSAVANRSYHPDELRKNKELSIDTEYYLKNQIHPVVARLLEPIDGTDAGQIADCLGLSASEFLRAAQTFDAMHNEIGMGMMSQMSDAERFKNAKPLTILCKECNSEHKFDGVFSKQSGALHAGLLCPTATCAQQMSVPNICNQVTLAMREKINLYYRGELSCDDDSCTFSGIQHTRQLSCRGSFCPDRCCRGMLRPVYSDAQLYSQLSYYQMLFDVDHAIEQLPEESRSAASSLIAPFREPFSKVFNHVDRQLQKSARKHVDLGGLFTRLGLKD